LAAKNPVIAKTAGKPWIIVVDRSESNGCNIMASGVTFTTAGTTRKEGAFMSDFKTTEPRTELDAHDPLKKLDEEGEELTAEDLGELSGGTLTMNHNETCTFID
jgi:hypothetical protein